MAITSGGVRKEDKDPDALRIGILGASKIAPPAVIWPAAKRKDVVVSAVAARDRNRAEHYAKKHAIERVHSSYQELLDDPEIDAIYNPLPNGLHAYWTIEALKKGKHVLCEKPFASNANEAAAMLDASKKYAPADGRKGGLLLVEAFHYRFHPLASRIKELLSAGTVGTLLRVETAFEAPFFFIPKSDIRYSVRGSKPELAGGAMMDTGTYAVNFLRYLVGRNPESVDTVQIKEAFPGIDQYTKADMTFPGGVTGSATGSFNSWWPQCWAKMTGSEGSIFVQNFVIPFVYNRVDIRDTKGKLVSREKVYGAEGATTYEHQLDAFVKAVRMDPNALRLVEQAGSAAEAVENMKVLDSIYLKSGLLPRKGPALN